MSHWWIGYVIRKRANRLASAKMGAADDCEMVRQEKNGCVSQVHTRQTPFFSSVVSSWFFKQNRITGSKILCCETYHLGQEWCSSPPCFFCVFPHCGLPARKPHQGLWKKTVGLRFQWHLTFTDFPEKKSFKPQKPLVLVPLVATLAMQQRNIPHFQ